MIPDDMLLRTLRRPVTRTDASITLLSEYAQAAADRIEELKRDLDAHKRGGKPVTVGIFDDDIPY